jgi:hypothetical protein
MPHHRHQERIKFLNLIDDQTPAGVNLLSRIRRNAQNAKVENRMKIPDRPSEGRKDRRDGFKDEQNTHNRTAEKKFP